MDGRHRWVRRGTYSSVEFDSAERSTAGNSGFSRDEFSTGGRGEAARGIRHRQHANRSKTMQDRTRRASATQALTRKAPRRATTVRGAWTDDGQMHSMRATQMLASTTGGRLTTLRLRGDMRAMHSEADDNEQPHQICTRSECGDRGCKDSASQARGEDGTQQTVDGVGQSQQGSKYQTMGKQAQGRLVPTCNGPRDCSLVHTGANRWFATV